MRSSGTTLSHPEAGPIALRLLVRGDDHPKACTGRRLLSRGLARPAHPAEVARALVLDPYAPRALSAGDRSIAVRSGIVVVDCSWNRLSLRRQRGSVAASDAWGVRRRLPLLMATNPQHYGRWTQLNSVEAFGAALAVLGEGEEAARVLSGFHGGTSFLTVNAARLARYRECASSEAIGRAERELFGATSTEAVLRSEPSSLEG